MSGSSPDARTADAFSESWNRQHASVYTREQVVDWFEPVDLESLHGLDVLELGFGNGSLLYHVAHYAPARLAGVELGDNLDNARRNVEAALPPGTRLDLQRGDLTRVDLGAFDFVYCIGVLHHLSDPRDGFRAVLRHTRPGGRFHAWVYAREGNALVRWLVDPLRRVTSRLPWWITRYLVALPAVTPYFVYAKCLRALFGAGPPRGLAARLPLAHYSLWIAEQGFGFFHHVAFDQLVTPRTAYIGRAMIEDWLRDPDVEPGSGYVVFRNGNSWKFGGRRRGGGESQRLQAGPDVGAPG